MAEFAPTTPAMRLFDEIDLAPAPQVALLQRVLNAWREQRADRLVPAASAVQDSVASELASNVFLFSPAGDSTGFDLASAGSTAMDIFGCHTKGSGAGLSEFANRRVAVYARHLFEMATKRREAVGARFTLRPPGEEPQTYEMLVAPVSKGEARDWLFGALSAI